MANDRCAGAPVQAHLGQSVSFSKVGGFNPCAPETVRLSLEYRAIRDFYGDQVAARSQVPLINHIHQGLVILGAIGASETAKKAYCLHPLFQNDQELSTVAQTYLRNNPSADPYVVMLAMEYRQVANAYLSRAVMPENGIKLSVLPEVNDMLIADKVQNRKDFDLYHKGAHVMSDRLTQYFGEWLKALGVSDDCYKNLIEMASRVS